MLMPTAIATAARSAVNFHPGVLSYNAFQLLGIAAIGKGEIEKPMPYSKFAQESTSSNGESASASAKPMVPSRTGMLIIYVPATIMAFLFQLVLPQFFASIAPTAAGWMVLAHFLKRDAEVLFLHRYSGNTELGAAQLIAVSYALTALMISLTTDPSVSAIGNASTNLGGLLFAAGSLGNLYHHYLLALLRSTTSTSATQKYIAPRGGLFGYVAAPHYFFELVAWLGIAIASQQLTSYLNLVSMTCYLCARSYNQNQWNQKKFDEKDWPASRKNMVPFVF